MTYQINTKNIKPFIQPSSVAPSNVESVQKEEPKIVWAECYEDQLFKYLLDENIIDFTGEISDQVLKDILLPPLEDEEVERLIGILNEQSLLSHYMLPNNIFIKADLDTLPEVINKYFKKNKLAERFSRELCGGVVKYILGLSYFKRALEHIDMNHWIEELPSYIVQELSVHTTDVDQKIYVPSISSKGLRELQVKTIKCFEKKIRKKNPSIPKRDPVLINRNSNLLSNNLLIKDELTKDEFFIISYGGSNSQAVDNVVIKQVSRKYLFASDAITLSIPSYVNYNEFKLFPQSIFYSGWQYIFSILTKTIVINEPEKVNFNGWLRLISQFTKGYTATHSTVEGLFRNKLLECRNESNIAPLIITNLKNHHASTLTTSSVIFLYNAFVYLSQEFDQTVLTKIATEVFSFQVNVHIENPFLNQLKALLLSEHIPFNIALATLTVISNLKDIWINQDIEIINRPLLDGIGIQIRYVSNGHLHTILFPNNLEWAWKSLAEFCVNNKSLEAKNALQALWDICKENFSYHLLKKENFLTSFCVDFNFKTHMKEQSLEDSLFTEIGLIHDLLKFLKEKNLNYMLDIYNLTPHLLNMSDEFQKKYMELLCNILERVISKPIDSNYSLDTSLHLKIRIVNLALQTDNTWIYKQIIKKVYQEKEPSIQKELQILAPKIKKTKELTLVLIKLEISKLFNQELSNELLDIYEKFVLENDFKDSQVLLHHFSTYTIQILNSIKSMSKKEKKRLNREKLAYNISTFVSKASKDLIVNFNEIYITFADAFLTHYLFKNKTNANENFLKNLLDYLLINKKTHSRTIKEIVEYFEKNDSLDLIRNFIESNPSFDPNVRKKEKALTVLVEQEKNIRSEILQLTEERKIQEIFDKMKAYINFLKNNKLETLHLELNSMFNLIFKSLNKSSLSKDELKSTCLLLLNLNKVLNDLQIEFFIESQFTSQILNLLKDFDFKKQSEASYYELFGLIIQKAINADCDLNLIESLIIKIAEHINSKQNNVSKHISNTFFDHLQFFVLELYDKIAQETLVHLLNQLSIKNHPIKDSGKFVPLLNYLIKNLNYRNILNENKQLASIHTLLDRNNSLALNSVEVSTFFDHLLTAFSNQKLVSKEFARLIVLAFTLASNQETTSAAPVNVDRLITLIFQNNQLNKYIPKKDLNNIFIQILKKSCSFEKFSFYKTVTERLLIKDSAVFSDQSFYKIHHEVLSKKLNEKNLNLYELSFFFSSQLVKELALWKDFLSNLHKIPCRFTQQHVADAYIEFEKNLLNEKKSFELNLRLSCLKSLKLFIDSCNDNSILKYFSKIDELVNRNKDLLDQKEVVAFLQSLIVAYSKFIAANKMVEHLAEIDKFLKSNTYKLLMQSPTWHADNCIQFAVGYILTMTENKEFCLLGGNVLVGLFEKSELKVLSDAEIDSLNQLIFKLPTFISQNLDAMIFEFLTIYIYTLWARSKHKKVNLIGFLNLTNIIKKGCSINFVEKHHVAVFNQIKDELNEGLIKKFLFEIQSFYTELFCLRRYQEIEESLLRLNFEHNKALEIQLINSYIEQRRLLTFQSIDEMIQFLDFCCSLKADLGSDQLYKMFSLIVELSLYDDYFEKAITYVQKLTYKYLDLKLNVFACFETFLDMVFTQTKDKDKLQKLIDSLRKALSNRNKENLICQYKLFHMELFIIERLVSEFSSKSILSKHRALIDPFIQIEGVNNALDEFAYNGFRYDESLCEMHREQAYALAQSYENKTKKTLPITKELQLLNASICEDNIDLTSEDCKKYFMIILLKVIKYQDPFVLILLLNILEKINLTDPQWETEVYTHIITQIVLSSPFDFIESAEQTRLELLFSHFNQSSRCKGLFFYLQKLLKCYKEQKITYVDAEKKKHVISEIIQYLCASMGRLNLSDNSDLTDLYSILTALKAYVKKVEMVESFLALSKKYSQKKFPKNKKSAQKLYSILAKGL